jgi:Na+-transporting methylmalonyl-CoA/oxaloacetate decarboxylase gamma subunit
VSDEFVGMTVLLLFLGFIVYVTYSSTMGTLEKDHWIRTPQEQKAAAAKYYKTLSEQYSNAH